MTTINASNALTLIELAKRRDPDGAMAVIAEVLARDNEVIKDAVWVEGNQATSHRITRRLSLPSGSWRRINSGVAKEASQTINVTEPIGMLEAYSEVDKALADMASDPGSFRMTEASAFLEGMSQTLAATLIYGDNGADPEKFDGLAVRMAGLDADGLVLGAGGSGNDLTSVYVVQWGEARAALAYPKGHPFAGITHRDLGEVTLTDGTGNLYQGYRDHFSVYCGLVVKDTRAIGRIANIETTGSSNLFDEDLLIRLLNRMPGAGDGAVIYVNETVKTQMEIKLKDKQNVWFTVQNGLGGEPVLSFRGRPVRKVDAIVNTEAELS